MNQIAFGEKLKELRKNRGFSRRELADGVCSEGYLYRVERGLYVPSLIVLNGLGEKLGHSFYLLTKDIDYDISFKVKEICDEIDFYEKTGKQEKKKELINQLVTLKNICNTNLQKTISMYEFLMYKDQELSSVEQVMKLKSLISADFELETFLKEKAAHDLIDLRILNFIGVVYIKMKQYDQALKYFMAVKHIAKNEQVIDQMRTVYATVLYNIAFTQFEQGSYELLKLSIQESKDWCQKKGLLFPLSSIQYLEGKYLLKMGKRTEAVEVFNSFIKLVEVTGVDQTLIGYYRLTLDKKYDIQV